MAGAATSNAAAPNADMQRPLSAAQTRSTIDGSASGAPPHRGMSRRRRAKPHNSAVKAAVTNAPATRASSNLSPPAARVAMSADGPAVEPHAIAKPATAGAVRRSAGANPARLQSHPGESIAATGALQPPMRGSSFESAAAIAPATTNGIDINTMDAHHTTPSDARAPTAWSIADRPSGDRAAKAKTTQANASARIVRAVRVNPAGAAQSGGKVDATVLSLRRGRALLGFLKLH